MFNQIFSLKSIGINSSENSIVVLDSVNINYNGFVSKINSEGVKVID